MLAQPVAAPTIIRPACRIACSVFDNTGRFDLSGLSTDYAEDDAAVALHIRNQGKEAPRPFEIDISITNRTAFLTTCSAGMDPLLRGLHSACAIGAWLKGGMVLHAAGILSPSGHAIVALAPSGGGKSTLTDLSRHISLSDEAIAIYSDRGTPEAAGTIFRSSAITPPRLVVAGLSAFIILEKSKQAAIVPAAPTQTFRLLATQAFRFEKKVGLEREFFRRIGSLSNKIPSFIFRFPKSSHANDLLDSLFDRLTDSHP